MPIDLSHITLTTWIIIGVVVLVGWTLLRFVLRLTMRIFSMGCLGLVILGAIVYVISRFAH
jgi:hypothetical protein